MSMHVEFHPSLTPDQQVEWTRFWAACQHSHPRQHVLFGQVERAKGRTPIFVMARENGTLVLVGLFSVQPRSWLGGASLDAICQRGPLFDDPAHLRDALPSMVAYFRALRAGRISVSMRWVYPEAADLETVLGKLGFTRIRPDGAGSGIVCLEPDENRVLASFSQSTRSQIRLAERRGVVVRTANSIVDAELFLGCFRAMQEQRGLRPIPHREFPATFEYVLRHQELGVLVIACYGEKFLGGMSVVRDTTIAYPSRYAIARELPAEIATVRIGPLLWWKAIRWARSQGCRYMDVEGFSPNPDSQSQTYHIHTFKAGFRPTPITLLAAYTCVGNRLVNTIHEIALRVTHGVQLARSAPYQIHKRVLARLRPRDSKTHQHAAPGPSSVNVNRH